MTMRISYGIELQEANDKYFKMIERLAHVGEDIAIPGRFLVEAIPWLRFLPEWMPGAGFKRFALAAKHDILFTINYLYATAKAAMVRPATFPSCRDVLIRLGRTQDHARTHSFLACSITLLWIRRMMSRRRRCVEASPRQFTLVRFLT